MRLLAVGKAERRSEVLRHVGASLLDGLDDGLVEGLLVGDLGLWVCRLVLGVGKERRLGLGAGNLLAVEVGVVDLVVNLDEWNGSKSVLVFPIAGRRKGWSSTHLDTSDVNLGARSNDVGLVDPADGHTVDLEGTGNEQKTALELLEEDDTLATEASGQEDQHSAGRDRRSERSRLGALPALLGHGHVLSGVVARSLDDGLGALATLDVNRLGSPAVVGLLRGSNLAVRLLVRSLLLEHLGAAQAADVGARRRVSCSGGHPCRSVRKEVVLRKQC